MAVHSRDIAIGGVMLAVVLVTVGCLPPEKEKPAPEPTEPAVNDKVEQNTSAAAETAPAEATAYRAGPASQADEQAASSLSQSNVPTATGTRSDTNASTSSSGRNQESAAVKAEVGVGKRGRTYGGGYITEPVRQYFRTQDRISFMQLEYAMKNFKVLNGRPPKSQEEFTKEIIKASAISLPELPEGEEYFYDPERGELMVRRPK